MTDKASGESWNCPSKIYLWEISIDCLGEEKIKEKLKNLKGRDKVK